MAKPGYFISFSVFATSPYGTKIFNNVRIARYNNLAHFKECQSKGFPTMTLLLPEYLSSGWAFNRILDTIVITNDGSLKKEYTDVGDKEEMRRTAKHFHKQADSLKRHMENKNLKLVTFVTLGLASPYTVPRILYNKHQMKKSLTIRSS